MIEGVNCENLIGETIESVLNQTYQHFEVIIVDDCSTDPTANVIRSYCQKDNRVRMIRLEHNSGVSIARNTAISNAQGRFLAFIDADDLWMPRKLEMQIAFMLDKRYGFTFTGYESFQNGSNNTGAVFSVPSSVNYNQYLRNTIIGNLTVMIDRKIIHDFKIQEGELEDVITWMYYLKRGYIAHGLNCNLAKYRVYRNSRSGNKLKNAKRFYYCLREQQLSPKNCVINECFYLFNAIKKRIIGRIHN